jgi:hypothetical protein
MMSPEYWMRHAPPRSGAELDTDLAYWSRSGARDPDADDAILIWNASAGALSSLKDQQ